MRPASANQLIRGRDLIASKLFQAAFLLIGFAFPFQTVLAAPRPSLLRVNAGARVTGIVTDKAGFVWFSSEAGLVRNDGFETTVFRLDGQPRGLDIDDAGNLWAISTRDKLIRIADQRVLSEAASPAAGVNVLHCTNDEIWVGANNGLFKRGVAGGRLKQVTSLSTSPVRAIASASNQEILIGSDLGVFAISAAPPHHTRSIGEPLPVVALAQDRKGRVWIAYKDRLGASVFSPDGSERIAIAPPFPNTHAFLSDATRGMWIGTDLGLYLAEDLALEPIDLGGGFDPRLMTLASDNDRRVWVGTASSGAILVDPNPAIRNIGRSQGLSSEIVFSVVADAKSGAWATTVNSLVKIDGDGNVTQFKHSATGVPYDSRALSVSKDGVWVSSWNFEIKKVIAPPSPMGGNASIVGNTTRGLVFEDAQQGIWTALATGGLQWKPVGRKAQDVPLPNANAVVVFAQGLNNQVLLGTKTGEVLVAQNGKVQLHPTLQPTHPARTLSIAQFSSGVICVGREDLGLSCADGKRARQYDLRSSRSSVGGLIEDRDGAIWLCTTDGITRISGLTAPLPQTISLMTLGLDAGLKSVECPIAQGPSAARLSDGTLLFASTAGLVQVDPSEFRRAPTFQIVVDDVQADGESLASDATEIPSTTRTLQIDFRSPRFLRRDELSFRYRLDGQDAVWNEAKGSHHATYTNLLPGTYRFVVEATDGQSIKRAMFAFSKPPHWSQTWVARLGFVALILLACISGIRVRKSVKNQQLQIMRAERQRLAQELHDTTDQNVFAVRLQLDEAIMRMGDGDVRSTPVIRHLERAWSLLDVLTQNTRDIIHALREGESNLPLDQAIEQNAHRWFDGTGIQIKVQTVGSIPAVPLDIRHQLLAIIGEAVANAASHGKSRNIVATISSSPNAMSISLVDDGTGFDVEAAITSGRHGLIGMRERARKFGGSVEIVSSLGNGTRILVRVPL